MANYREVFKTEKYMDDATESILSNISKGLIKRKQQSIWDPIEPSIEIESHDSDPSERYKLLTKILSENCDSSDALNTKRYREENRFASGNAVKRNDFANRRPPKSFYPYERRSHQNNQEETIIENSMLEEYNLEIQNYKAMDGASELNHSKKRINRENKQDQTLNNNAIANSNLDVKKQSGSETSGRRPLSYLLEEQGNPQSDKMLLNSFISDTSLDVQSMEPETFDVVNQTDRRSDFASWCEKRQKQFNIKSLNYPLLKHDSKTVTFKSKVEECEGKNPITVKKNKITDHLKKYSKSKSEIDFSDIGNRKSNHAKMYSKSKSEVDISIIENKNTDCAKKHSKGRSEDNLAKIQACIKLANENYEKDCEFVVDISDLYRIKRRFPKLNDILPDIDTATTTVPCCFEAVNIILRYLFFGWSNNLPNATTAVEVLAATKNWEINKFYSMFYDCFIQKILPSSNIKIIFSQASHYNLHEVCNACQEVNINGASLNSSYKRKQKKCSISITTYIEPLEFCIPLYTLEHSNFELIFERHILNIVRFQSLSGFFTIVGIQISLNGNHVESNNNSMLNIDYNAKNLTEELELGTGRFEKPLRPINVIHFKNPLNVNPKQIVEITVETDLKPFLCCTYPEEIQIRKRIKDGEFILNMISNLKIPKSKENLFILGKLLYYVKKQPKC